MSARPIAVRLGLTLVSVSRSRQGWAACMWSRATKGPVPLSQPTTYEAAVDRARAYVAIDPTVRVLDLPLGVGDVEGRGLVHLDLRDSGEIEVMHESASGNSFATLRTYPKEDRKRACLFALDVLATYSNPKGASRLGRVLA